MTIRLTEHKTLHHQRLIAFILIIIAAAIVGYFAIASMYFTKEIAVVEQEPVAEAVEIKDIVYFSAQENGDDTLSHVVYGYDITTEEWSSVFDTPLVYSSIEMLDADYALASLYDESGDESLFTPWLLSETDSMYMPLNVSDYRIERDYVVSKDGAYAVAYSVTDATEENDAVYSLDNWSIVLASLDNMVESREITAAARPQWINDFELIYLKSDGLYTYDLVNDIENSVELSDPDITFKFSAREELVATQDSKTLVITSPGDNQMLVLNRTEEGTYEMFYDVVSTDTVYSSPVISPDENQLAVLVNTFISNPELETIDIKLYNFGDLSQPVRTLPLPVDAYSLSSLELVGWTQSN